jgi:hypothetical protein
MFLRVAYISTLFLQAFKRINSQNLPFAVIHIVFMRFFNRNTANKEIKHVKV